MIRVRVPATTANLGPGFDCMGLALDLWNTFEFHPRGKGFVVESHGEGASTLPGDHTNLIISTMNDEIGRLAKAVGAMIEELPVWPFDARTLRTFGSAYVVPFVLPFLSKGVEGLATWLG